MTGAETWTDDVVETLKQLVSEGHSGGQIAKTLGLTRNQVVGKVMRMKLQLDGGAADVALAAPVPAIAANRSVAVSRAAKVKSQIVVATVSTASAAPRPAPPEIAAQRADDYFATPARRKAFDPAHAPAGARFVQLVNLQQGMCKWPLFEEGPRIFCGCKVAAGEKGGPPPSYCDHHRQMSRGTTCLSSE